MLQSTNFLSANCIYIIFVLALSIISSAPNRKRNETIREPFSGGFYLNLSFNLFPFFVALPHSFYMSRCQSKMQFASVSSGGSSPSLPQTPFLLFESLNPPQQLLSIQIKALAEDCQKAFSLWNMKYAFLWGL